MPVEYVQIALWVVLFAGAGLLGLPIASAVFASLPGRGAGFAPTIAIGVVSLVTFWLGQLWFGSSAVVVGLVVLVALDALAYRLGVEIRWRAFGEAMTVFLIAFGFQLAVRAVDPGILFFTEDFLDYGMMRAILRSSTLPPEDFWFAGVRVDYHYGGHLVAAVETMVTGTRPSVAYNLARASFFGLLVTGAYELAGSIAQTVGRSRRAAGALGAYFVGFTGNLLAPVAVAVQALPEPVRTPVASAMAGQLHENSAEGIVHGLSEFAYWDVGQMMQNTLTPFPLFSWLHGELHAHMTSTPFLLALVAVCYAYYQTPDAERATRRALLFVVVPLVAGFTVLTDALSIPTSMGVVWLSLSFASAPPTTLVPRRIRSRLGDLVAAIPGDPAGWIRTEFRRLVGATVITAAVGLLALVVASPFVVTLGGGQGSIGLLTDAERSRIVPLLLIHGAFLGLFVPYLAERFRPSAEITRRTTFQSAMFGGIVLVGSTLLLAAPVIVLIVPVLVAGWYLLRVRDGVGFEGVLILAGAGLVFLVEFVYFGTPEYVFGRRANTIFRAYMHAWIFWGVAAGVVLPRLVRPPGFSWRQLPKRRTVRTVLVTGLVVSTAVYGGVSSYRHFDRAFEEPTESWEQAEYVYYATQHQDRPVPPTRPPTLEGLLHAEVNYPNQTRAIKWFDREVEGTPTLVTAPGGRWEWRSASASLTGVPTVTGWAHELLYRDPGRYYERVDDVRSIYRGDPERRVSLLREYGVEYVWVGPDERSRYDVWEFSLLDGVEPVYQAPDVTIYAVHQGSLGYSPDPVGTVTFDAETFTANGEGAVHRDGRIVATEAADGLSWWGPYLDAPPGDYVATFRVSVNATDATAGSEPAVVLDVARGADRRGTADYRVLANVSVNGTEGVRTVSVPFTLHRPVSDLEFRGTVVDENATVSLHNVTLAKNSSSG